MHSVYKLVLSIVVLFTVGALSYAQQRVADYPFSGNANDVSGFENHAAINGALLTQDRFNGARGAFMFDGESNFLAAPNAAHLNTDFTTVSFWAYANSIPAQGEVYLISFGGWQERYKVSLPNHGKLIWTTNADGISDMDSGDGNELVTGTWTHVAFVHDGTKDKIFMNGALVAEKDVAGPLNATTRPLGIGYNIFDGGGYFDGMLDDVIIFGEALSDQAIMDLYNDQSKPPEFDDGMVANYGFAGSFSDSTDFANGAKGTDAKFTTDRFGFGSHAVAFDGVSSTVDIANSNHLNSPAMSLAMWVKVNTLPPTGEAYIASHGGWQERWKISLPSHGKPVWTTNHENGISDMDSGDGNELAEGVWTHVVFIHDGAKDLIYMNGAKAAEKDVVGAMNSTGHPFGLGYNPIDDANFFDGCLDEVRVYNYALSDQEITDLYNAQSQSGVTGNEIAAQYPFAGDAKDATVWGNDGIVVGAVPGMDRFGYGSNAMRFSGAEMIYAPNSPQYQSEVTSVSFWINVAELPPTGEYYILSHGGWQQRWKISLPSHGKPVWTTNHENGISDMDSGDGNALVPGTWTHVVMVHDGTRDIIYFDGAQVAEKDVAGNLNKTSHPFGMGFNPIDGGSFFNGMLDEVMLFNVALDASEVADLYADQSADPGFADELVANYPFSGNAYDETPFKNHANVSSAVLGPDRFERGNHAYSFDGLGSTVTASNSKQLNSTTTSVCFWVNVRELPPTGESYILSHGGWQQRWKISLPQHGKPVWTTNHANGISDMDSGDGNELVPGTWTHVVMVHDGAKDLIYMDGAQVAEKDVAGDMNSTEHPFGIGYNPIDNANYFNGMLDEVRVYNRALTAQEIADLYAEQSTPPMIEDTEAPSAPVDLVGTVEFTTVGLSWCESTDNVGVAGYNIIQDTAVIMQTRETSVAIEELKPLTAYTFGVSAYDAAGNVSPMTTVNVMTDVDETPDTIPPTAPPNLAASVGSNSVVISWDASTDDQAVGGYIIYLEGELLDSTDASTLSYFIGGLEPETPYYIEVQAFDLAGNNSEFSDIVATTNPPVDTGEDGLVAHYPFEGNANDATPYENHGVEGGDPQYETVTNRPNAAGQAIVFDGDQDSVLAPNGPQLISDYTSVGFWIRVDDQNLDDAEAYVLDFGHWDQRWKVSLPQHLKIVWTTNSKTNQFPSLVSDMDSGDGNELVKSFWWYITMVHDGTDDIVYLDGEEVNRKPAPGTLNSTARPFGFGSNPVDGGQYFIGALDEVKVYNKALTADEIEKLYNTGTTGIGHISPDLVKYIDVLYPNPATDVVVLNHKFDTPQELLIRVFDQQGRQVDAQRVDANDLATGVITWNISNYPEGYYVLNFILGGKDLGGMPLIKQ